ncbi:hypothetical protein [Silvanigrella aquatica]|uniref:Uncharacterized protein n=1 Tax=Silvanigrella aquatica TaxID=1915309 RepID=A0A1L4D029_9BACT|nr:hypothetical protein [Silvanigrella aquatica]APJ03561.1 hypothetical protein AXG55_06425 [Silvanigrella aquatica]
MRKIILYILRSVILIALFLPIIYPFILKKAADERSSYINIFIPADILLKSKDKNEIQKIITDNFGDSVKIQYINYGQKENLPSQDYEDLLSQISKIRGSAIIISNSTLFGEDAQKFNTTLKKLPIFIENRVFFIPLKKINSFNIKQDDYLVLSDIFIPRISFLGEESMASVNIIGKAKPKSEIKAEIILHSGNSFLNSKIFQISVPDNGLVNHSIQIPINFTKTGNQIITADITSNLAHPPLNSASTTVQVVFSKTTLLHISVGPDWNLRTVRQKLKFWPNLDLLSYYILRETNSDQSIPNSQLSLIEFPADKLFGSSLQNFHGIVAQNFLFDTYLGDRESENLVGYVKNGGRLVIQGGPLSFLSESKSINSLFPCENKPKWDNENVYHWVSNQSNFISSQSFMNSLSHIVTHYTAINCKPKKEALVLAKTNEGDHPVLLAMPAQKGIVLTFLGSDWLYGYTQEKVQDTTAMALRMKESDSSEYIFNWMVEFLQRRQDSGVRAPDIAGPRIYANDKYLSVKSKGDIQIENEVTLESKSKKSIKGTLFKLNRMDKELIHLNGSINSIENIQNSNKNSNTLVDLALIQGSANAEVFRYASWPIYPLTAKSQETLENPFLFDGIPSLSATTQDLSKEVYVTSKKVPLLDAFPWILGFSLFLLCIEQFLARILWRGYF